MFVLLHPFLDISIKSTKLHFQSWRKNSPTISLFLVKLLPRNKEITVANGTGTEQFLDIYWISKVGWTKLTRFRVCLSSLQYTPSKDLKALAKEMYRMKRLLNLLETCTLFIQQKATEKGGLYTHNTLKVRVLQSSTIVTLEKEMDRSLLSSYTSDKWSIH